MAKSGVIKPSELRRKRRRRRNLRIIFWIVSILVIIFGLGFLTHLPAMTVNNIVAEGNDSIPAADLIKVARNDMAGNYLFIFSKSNIFLYPKSRIKNDILNQYKQISGISIRQDNLESIRLSLNERKPDALWCRDTLCYFMDQTGYIFAPAPTFSGNLYLTYSGLITAENPVGTTFLSPPKFIALASFLNNVKKLGISFDSLSAADENDFQLHLSGGGQIFFTDTQSFDQTLGNLQTVIDKNNPSGNSIDLSQTEYVDLRFGNKIVYKLKGAATSATSAATSTATTSAQIH